MLDVRLDRYLEAQDDLISWWQLRAIGWSPRMIDQQARAHRWRVEHRGVYALNRAPLTQRQRWIAAVLTAPNTFLVAQSACACYGFYEWRGGYETVVRPGNGGPRRYPGLLVARSSTLKGATTRREGLPIVTAERALLSVAPSLSERQRGRVFREACRLKVTTANDIARMVRGRRGSRSLVGLCDRYSTIPYHRCRSDAECRGLEVLHDAGIEPPLVNVKVAGRRPDFYWPQHRLIIEIDSKAFHPFPDIDDAENTEIWERAGNTVRRIWANDVYHRPRLLVDLFSSNVQLATA